MTIEVKICGLRDESGVKAAVDSGARYLGFVFHPRSTRFISPENVAALTALIPPSVMRVGLLSMPTTMNTARCFATSRSICFSCMATKQFSALPPYAQ